MVTERKTYELATVVEVLTMTGLRTHYAERAHPNITLCGHGVLHWRQADDSWNPPLPPSLVGFKRGRCLRCRWMVVPDAGR